MSHRYQDLVVWQKARRLAVEVYCATEKLPKAEVYGLTSQIRRAAISVVSYIAEGQGRLTKGEFQQFLGHSRGSLLELETQLLVATDLHYIGSNEFDRLQELIAEVGRLLNGLIESLRVKGKSAGA